MSHDNRPSLILSTLEQKVVPFHSSFERPVDQFTAKDVHWGMALSFAVRTILMLEDAELRVVGVEPWYRLPRS